jgi:hypothetical protein
MIDIKKYLEHSVSTNITWSGIINKYEEYGNSLQNFWKKKPLSKDLLNRVCPIDKTAKIKANN